MKGSLLRWRPSTSLCVLTDWLQGGPLLAHVNCRSAHCLPVPPAADLELARGERQRPRGHEPQVGKRQLRGGRAGRRQAAC